jgi:RNA polymerase sigma-70 factor, ECF subfamily
VGGNGIQQDVSAVLAPSAMARPAAPLAAAEPVSLAEWRLLRRAQAGEVVAFAELYRTNVGRIHALCLRLTGRRDEAEDATQEAFVRAWRGLTSFRGDSAFSTWLFRIAVNVVLATRRSRARQRLADLSTDELADQVPQTRGCPALAADLETAIRALPAGARTAFVLHEIEGYSHQEAASLTGLATGTLKAQLHRARRLLREALAP